MIQEILFEHSMPTATLWIGLLAAVALGLFSFWRYVGRGSTTLWLTLLRMLFLLLLGWCLFRPAHRKSESEQLKSRFLVVVDTSASMSLSPKEEIPTRWSVVQEVLKQPWATEIPLRAELDAYPFDTKIGSKTPLAELVATEPNGTGTRLRDSLRQVADRYRGQPIAGILLLSDGLDTRELGDDWAAGPWPAPIYSVRLEPENTWEETPDVRVVRVDTPRRVVVGWQSELTAVISGNGTKGQQIDVELYENDVLVQKMPTQIPAQGGNRDVKFQLEHPKIGNFVYKVRVPPLPKETVTQDNEFSIAVDVTDTKNRVLYVEGVPRFDFKFLKRALEKSKDVTPIILMQGPDGKLISVGHSGSVNLTMSKEQLAQFKIAILGNMDATTLGEERAKALVKFVEEGGSLILLGGDEAWGAQGFAATPLKELMPIQRDASKPQEEGKYTAALTKEGMTHPALEMVAKKWTKPMPILSIFPGATPSPAATTVMAADDHPLIVMQRFGQGKVAAVLSNSLWRWQLEPGQKDEYTALWAGLLQWLMPQASQVDAYSFDLTADVEQLYLGDAVTLTARLGGKDLPDTEAAPVTLEIQTPDGRKIPYPMVKTNAAGGKNQTTFSAEYKADAGGMHNAVATITIEGRKVESTPFSFFVKPFTPETSPRPQNVALLQALAQASGGQFCEKESLNNLLMKLDIRTEEEQRVLYKSLWDSAFILVAMMALLCGDWVLRKRRNMP